MTLIRAETRYISTKTCSSPVEHLLYNLGDYSQNFGGYSIRFCSADALRDQKAPAVFPSFNNANHAIFTHITHKKKTLIS